MQKNFTKLNFFFKIFNQFYQVYFVKNSTWISKKLIKSNQVEENSFKIIQFYFSWKICLRIQNFRRNMIVVIFLINFIKFMMNFLENSSTIPIKFSKILLNLVTYFNKICKLKKKSPKLNKFHQINFLENSILISRKLY